jgi:hypothetical protein
MWNQLRFRNSQIFVSSFTDSAQVWFQVLIASVMEMAVFLDV